jgi:hypothetical protein
MVESPTISPSGAKGVRKVDATKMPPGLSTLLISAMAAWGLGQQWIAAPAWMASTLPVAKGRRPTSARTATMGVLQDGREGKGSEEPRRDGTV